MVFEDFKGLECRINKINGKNLKSTLKYLESIFEETIQNFRDSWKYINKNSEYEPWFVQDYREYVLISVEREFNWLMEEWDKLNEIETDTILAVYHKLLELSKKHKPIFKSRDCWKNEINHVRRHLLVNAQQFGNVFVPKTCKICLPCGHDEYFTNVEIGLNQEGKAMLVKHIKPSAEPIMRQTLASVRRLHHQHVLSYYLTPGPDSTLVMPLMSLNLGQYVMYLSWTQQLTNKASQIVYQIINGLAFLHKSNHPPIIHGNLKPTNIFIDKNLKIKLADFGMNFQTKPCNSSLIWKSTEQVRGNPCMVSLSSDVASAGMIAHFVLTAGRHPYGVSISEILSNLISGNFELTTTDAVVNDLLTNMLEKEENDRLDISEVTRHIFWWPLTKRWDFVNQIKEKLLIQFLLDSAEKLNFQNDKAILCSKGGAKGTQQDIEKFCHLQQLSTPLQEIQLEIPNLPLHLYQILKPTGWAQSAPLKLFFDARYF